MPTIQEVLRALLAGGAKTPAERAVAEKIRERGMTTEQYAESQQDRDFDLGSRQTNPALVGVPKSKRPPMRDTDIDLKHERPSDGVYEELRNRRKPR